MKPSEVRELVKTSIAEPGYRLIQARIEAAIATKRAELEKDLGEAETQRVRGELRGLRLALEVPAILMREGEAGGNTKAR